MADHGSDKTEDRESKVVPIWEQGQGKGIGHSLDSFLTRFDEICREHIESRKATSFALMFYDLTDHGLKKVLKDHQVFTKLDRMAGQRLRIFDLHNPRKRNQAKAFNNAFQERLGLSVSGPCIVSFRLNHDQFCDVQVCTIESSDAMHGFQEVYEIFSTYRKKGPAEVVPSKRWVVLRSGARWITKEAISTVIKESLDKGRILEHLSHFIHFPL